MSTPTCTVIFANASYISPDTYENYAITLDSESPDIPTEQATINTNVIRQPRKFTIDLIFTPWPQGDDMRPQAGADRPQKAVDQLYNAWLQRQLVDLIIKGETYRNCAISVSYSLDQTDSIKVGCQFKELLIASSASVKLKPTTSKLKKATGKKVKAQTLTEAGQVLKAGAEVIIGDYFTAIRGITQ